MSSDNNCKVKSIFDSDEESDNEKCIKNKTIRSCHEETKADMESDPANSRSSSPILHTQKLGKDTIKKFKIKSNGGSHKKDEKAVAHHMSSSEASDSSRQSPVDTNKQAAISASNSHELSHTLASTSDKKSQSSFSKDKGLFYDSDDSSSELRKQFVDDSDGEFAGFDERPDSPSSEGFDGFSNEEPKESIHSFSPKIENSPKPDEVPEEEASELMRDLLSRQSKVSDHVDPGSPPSGNDYDVDYTVFSNQEIKQELDINETGDNDFEDTPANTESSSILDKGSLNENTPKPESSVPARIRVEDVYTDSEEESEARQIPNKILSRKPTRAKREFHF